MTRSARPISAKAESETSTRHEHQRHLWALVLVVGSAVIFSTGGLFVRSMHVDDAWTTVFWRSVSAAASIAVFLALRERGAAWRNVRAMGLPGVGVGVAFSVSSIGMVVALTMTSVAATLVILALTPLAAAVIGRVFLADMVHRPTWIAITLTVVGVTYMVSGPGADASAGGVAVALMIPLSFGAGAVVLRRHPEVGMVPAMLLACVISAVVALPLSDPLSVDRHDLIVLLLFGAAQLGVGLAMFAIGGARLPATEATLLAMLEPVLGPIWVWVFKDEYPGVPALIGGSLVFVTLTAHAWLASSWTAAPGEAQLEAAH
jgi:drug/metabolite transporter (DMT)-like permease